MKILVIDNNLDPDSWGEDLARYAVKAAGALVEVRRAPHSDLPRRHGAYDRVVISGSRQSCLEENEWTSRLDQLIRACVNDGKPVLGICYGHQAIVRALKGVGNLRASERPERGWTSFEIVAPSRILEGLPKRFHSFSSHEEEVVAVPAGFTLLARSERCAIQAMEMQGRPVYGLQFHPEKDAAEAEKSFSGWKKKKLQNLLNPGKTSQLFDPKTGETIFGNFFRL